MLSSNNSNSSLERAVNGVSKPVKANTGSTSLMDSSRIPSPPPVPKMEYLLSKLPKSKQIQIHNLIRAESLLSNSSDGNDSDTGSVESGHSRSSGSGKRKKKDNVDSSPVLRGRNKLSSSPPLPRRARVRQLTPYVKADGIKKHPVPSPKRLFYDEALPLGQISPRHSSPSPTVSPFSSGGSSRNITPSSSFRAEATQSHNESSSPYDFMKALNTAMKKTPNKPRIKRQHAIDIDDNNSSDGSVSPTLLEIEHQLEAMQQMVDSDTHPNRQQLPSSTKDDHHDEDEDDDDDDDDDSSSTETSSEDDMDEFVQLNVIKPHMQAGVANMHMPKRKLSPAVLSGGLGGGVINRGRLVQKRQVYRPRLYSRRRFSRLDTILEETEENIYTGVRLCSLLRIVTGYS